MDTGIVNKSPSVYVYIVVSYNFFVSVRQLYIYQVDFDEIIKKKPRRNGNKKHIEFNVIHEVDDYQKGMRNNNRILPKKAV